MDKDLKAQLEDQLYERMSHENEAYLAELRTKPADEIINSAYQIACRENILYLFEEETQLNVRQLQVLMEMSSPLRELYEDWCGRDSNEMELLRGSIEDSTSGILNHRAEIRYSDPKTPIYEKTYTEAREQNELYEWKADHLQSYHCNRMFAQKAEGAHHCNAFHPFLQEWTEKYGLERCMFVLRSSCPWTPMPTAGSSARTPTTTLRRTCPIRWSRCGKLVKSIWMISPSATSE